MPKPTDVTQFIGELGAGVTEEKLAHMLTEVCGSVLAQQKQGEVTLKLKIKPAGSASDQVSIEHTLAYKRPKKRGSIAEDDMQETIMYVNEGNNPSQFPENQLDMIGKQELQHAD